MDKKTALVVFLTVLFFGAITAGGVILFLKPFGEDGAKKTSGGTFPISKKSNSAPATAAIPAPEGWGKKPSTRPAVRGTVPSQSGGGSLGFIQKDENFLKGGADKNQPGALEKNADAKALVEGLRQGRDKESGSLSDKAIRTVMQKVVDAVHDAQPKWYKQFLGNRNLKAIADRYDKDSDFESFVRLLAKSTPFKSMLKIKSKKPEMKELTWSMITDPEIGPSLKQIVLEKKDDPNLTGLLKNYGQNAGVPPEMLEAAGIKLKKSRSKKKRRSTRRSRPTLRKRGFSGYDDKGSSKSGSKSGSQPKMPADMSPEMYEKYKKYMKK